MSDARNCWHLYLLRCGDGSLYTGITTNVQRRLAEHQAPAGARGARALRGKRPLTLVFEAPVGGKSRALKLEHRVKRLNKRSKETLVNGELSLATLADS